MKATNKYLAFLLGLALMLGAGCLVVGCASSDSGAAEDTAATEAADEADDAVDEATDEADADADEATDEAADDADEATDDADEAVEEDDDDAASAATGDMAAAEALIGQEMSMDEIEAALGPSKKFDMSAEGCERGVMQGIFYYDGFSVYSRTYDKGNTFKIISVSD